MSLFDPKRHQIHLERSSKTFEKHRFLYDDFGAELIDRLKDIKRNFQNILNLSPHPLTFPEDIGLISELKPPFLEDLKLEENHFDLIISNLAFHWVEDMVGLMVQIRKALKPDGLFLASFFGGESLHELRTSLMEAELQLTGGASLRTAPMTRIQDAPKVLGRGGFALPVVDTEQCTITYSSMSAIVEDLRGMGETLKIQENSPGSRELFKLAEEIYFKKYATEENRLPVTVDVITLTGWAPCPTQGKALERGSASYSLESALEL
jgi:NADH dehydrogenase [ubiquinone] 1 alpha subcomplex assembly factor 5